MRGEGVGRARGSAVQGRSQGAWRDKKTAIDPKPAKKTKIVTTTADRVDNTSTRKIGWRPRVGSV